MSVLCSSGGLLKLGKFRLRPIVLRRVVSRDTMAKTAALIPGSPSLTCTAWVLGGVVDDVVHCADYGSDGEVESVEVDSGWRGGIEVAEVDDSVAEVDAVLLVACVVGSDCDVCVVLVG